MPTSRIATLAAALLALSAGTALAHDTRPVDYTQARQLQAIEQGRRDGSITRREYRDLVSEQARIADLEARVKADGVVTGREYRAIREAQRDASTHIASESHDGQVNYWRRWKSRHGF